MKGRVEIEKAENGWAVIVWKEPEEGSEDMYSEPTKYVATEKEEVLKIVKDNL